jgi:hypothetical protein
MACLSILNFRCHFVFTVSLGLSSRGAVYWFCCFVSSACVGSSPLQHVFSLFSNEDGSLLPLLAAWSACLFILRFDTLETHSTISDPEGRKLLETEQGGDSAVGVSWGWVVGGWGLGAG